MKYIVIECKVGNETREIPIIFPDVIVHADMAKILTSSPGILHGGKSVSGGFVFSLDTASECFGRSESLGISSRKEIDRALIVNRDNDAVDAFAAAMKDKLAKKRAEKFGGWANRSLCSTAKLRESLAEALLKGDPVDVGNYAAMLFFRGDKTS